VEDFRGLQEEPSYGMMRKILLKNAEETIT
jgi:hypothetical protein